MKIKSLFAAAILIFSLLLQGCADYEEIGNQLLVSGVAVDFVETDSGQKEYLVTAEVMIPGMGGSSESVETKLVSNKDKTILSAIRGLIGKTSRKLYFGHCAVIIFGDDVAKEGILSVLDLLFRDSEIQISLSVAVSRDCKGYELLQTKGVSFKITSFELYSTIRETAREYGISPHKKIYQFVNDMSDPANSSKVPYFTIQKDADGQNVAVLDGFAIFKDYKLCGYMDDYRSSRAMIAAGEYKTGVITCEVPSLNRPVTVKIMKCRVTHKVENDGFSPTVTVHASLGVVLSEIPDYVDLSYNGDIPHILHELEYVLSQDMFVVVKDTLDRYSADVFGLTVAVMRQDPSFWFEQVQNGGLEEMLRTVKIKTECEIVLESEGVSDTGLGKLSSSAEEKRETGE